MAGPAFARQPPVMDEADLLAKLARVEALVARGATAGERAAAAEARDRILARLGDLRYASQRAEPPREQPVEYRFTFEAPWSRRLFVALLSRHGIRPFRKHRQRRTTVRARIPPGLLHSTLWPEFMWRNRILRQQLDRVTRQVLGEVFDAG